MPTPHKHAEAIKAWADGYEIQWRQHPDQPWGTLTKPSFIPDYEYRKKPKEVVDYTIVHGGGAVGGIFGTTIDELKYQYTTSYNDRQGLVRRTRIDDQVISLDFIKK